MLEQVLEVWKFVADCKKSFQAFDKHATSATVWGFVEASDVAGALQDTGLKLPQKAVALVLKRQV